MLIRWTKQNDHTWTANLRGLPLTIVMMHCCYRLTINGQFSTLMTDTLAECMTGASKAFAFMNQ